MPQSDAAALTTPPAGPPDMVEARLQWHFGRIPDLREPKT
jgi:hypothetical protein